jgi:hypothetical protein
VDCRGQLGWSLTSNRCARLTVLSTPTVSPSRPVGGIPPLGNGEISGRRHVVGRRTLLELGRFWRGSLSSGLASTGQRGLRSAPVQPCRTLSYNLTFEQPPLPFASDPFPLAASPSRPFVQPHPQPVSSPPLPLPPSLVFPVHDVQPRPVVQLDERPHRRRPIRHPSRAWPERQSKRMLWQLHSPTDKRQSTGSQLTCSGDSKHGIRAKLTSTY